MPTRQRTCMGWRGPGRYKSGLLARYLEYLFAVPGYRGTCQVPAASRTSPPGATTPRSVLVYPYL